jgi:hypothetical protein
MDAHHPNQHKCAHNFKCWTSKHIDSIVMGNHEELNETNNISTNPLIQQNHIT